VRTAISTGSRASRTYKPELDATLTGCDLLLKVLEIGLDLMVHTNPWSGRDIFSIEIIQ